MSISFKLEIENLDKITRKFNKAPALITVELQKAILKSIFVLQAGARSTAPVDTGFLRMRHETSFPSPLVGKLTPKTDYAFFVHEGTKKMRSRPWLKDTMVSKKAQVQAFFNDILRKVKSL